MRVLVLVPTRVLPLILVGTLQVAVLILVFVCVYTLTCLFYVLFCACVFYTGFMCTCSCTQHTYYVIPCMRGLLWRLLTTPTHTYTSTSLNFVYEYMCICFCLFCRAAHHARRVVTILGCEIGHFSTAGEVDHTYVVGEEARQSLPGDVVQTHIHIGLVRS